MKIEGRNPVVEAIKADKEIDYIYVSKDAKGSISKIIGMAKDKKIIIKNVDKKKLDELSETKNHQGVIALVSEYIYYELEELLAIPEQRGEEPFFIILDGITDPHNFGAIVRTACGSGAHGIIIPKRRTALVTPTSIKTSAGTMDKVAICKVTNLNRTIDLLKKKNIWVGALDMGKVPYYKQDFKCATALVIGSEGKGVSPLVKKNSDFIVSIPMKNEMDSLNASVAGSIVMYEVFKQRS